MWNPYDRLRTSDTLQEIRRGYFGERGITVHTPTEAECTEEGCGHDEFTDSKRKIDCASCNERGYVVIWTTQTIYCRARWTNTIEYRVQIGPGVKIGDLMLHIRASDYETVKAVEDDPKAYMLLDGFRIRPTAIQPAGVGGTTDEYRVECVKIKGD